MPEMSMAWRAGLAFFFGAQEIARYTGQLHDLGKTRLVRWRRLSAHFVEDRLVGWYAAGLLGES